MADKQTNWQLLELREPEEESPKMVSHLRQGSYGCRFGIALLFLELGSGALVPWSSKVRSSGSCLQGLCRSLTCFEPERETCADETRGVEECGAIRLVGLGLGLECQQSFDIGAAVRDWLFMAPASAMKVQSSEARLSPSLLRPASATRNTSVSAPSFSRLCDILSLPLPVLAFHFGLPGQRDRRDIAMRPAVRFSGRSNVHSL
eukprot:s2399_g1.t1